MKLNCFKRSKCKYVKAEEAEHFVTDDVEKGIDQSEWMTNLPDAATRKPINQIAIPGTHDSGAFWLDPKTPICPDESSIIRNAGKIFGTVGKKVIINWSLTQGLQINEQLQHGARYFDMRNGYLESSDDIYFVHGLYGHRIEDLLNTINAFLNDHPKEIVILDFNHFYTFTAQLHSRFAKSIVSIFNDKLLPPTKNISDYTVNEIWNQKKQVVVGYDDADVCKTFTEFWPPNSIYSPWPNTSSTSTLITSLNERFNSLKPNSFNVFQAILSPQTSTILFHLFSSLKKVLCTKCDEAVVSWLSNVYASKQRGVNIFMCDFVSLDQCATDIIKLNDLMKNDK